VRIKIAKELSNLLHHWYGIKLMRRETEANITHEAKYGKDAAERPSREECDGRRDSKKGRWVEAEKSSAEGTEGRWRWSFHIGEGSPFKVQVPSQYWWVRSLLKGAL
jgi:hypothetical protein